jgi:hypothetical protein
MAAPRLGLALVALCAAVGCGGNPCKDALVSDSCVILTVKSDNIHSIEQLSVTSSLNMQTEMERSPTSFTGTDYSLPFDIGLIYPGSDVGTVDIIVDAEVGGSFRAEGKASFDLPSVRGHVTVTLDGTPTLSPTPDMAMPDLAPSTADMAELPVTQLVPGTFDAVLSSDNEIAAITHGAAQLMMYDTMGNQQAALDNGANVNSLIVTDTLVAYCASPTAIGTTGKESCTLKIWKPGATTGTQLATGVFPFAGSWSTDLSAATWTQNPDSMAMKADRVALINGVTTTLATQLPLANSQGFAQSGVVFATTTTGAAANQIDVVRQTTGAAVHICQNCDQFVVSSDGTQIAARGNISGAFGKIVVGATSIATTNGLGTSTTISPNADVSRIVDFVSASNGNPATIMYLSSNGASSTLYAYVPSAGTVSLRDSGVASIWYTTPDTVADAHTVKSDGSGDLWLAPKASASAVQFTTATGVVWDATGDDYYTFTTEPSSDTTGWFVVGGHGATQTPLFTFKAPSSDAVFLDTAHVVCYTTPNTMVYQDFVIGQGFKFNSTIVDFDVDRNKRRLLYVINGNGPTPNGIYQYTY